MSSGRSSTLPSTGRTKISHSAINQPLPQVPGSSDSDGSSPNDSGTGSVNIRFSKVSSNTVHTHTHTHMQCTPVHHTCIVC